MLDGPHMAPGPPLLAPSQEEKLMAALSHASVLIPHAGIVVPLVLWIVNQGKAPFAAYQSKQALFFHLAAIILTWAVGLLALLMTLPTLGLVWLLMIPVLGAVPVLAAVYGIIAAIQAGNGLDFRYWKVGEWVQPD